MSNNLIALSSARSCDIDDQAAMLAGWHQSYIQFERGNFEGSVQAAYFTPDSSIFRKQTNRKLHKVFAAPPGTAAVAVQLSGSSQSVFQGIETGPGDVLVIPPGQQIRLICHGFFDVIVATFQENSFQSADECVESHLKPSVLKGNEGIQLGRWLKETLAILQRSPGSLNSQAITLLRDEMRDKCRHALNGLQMLCPQMITPSQATQIVNEARKIADVALDVGDTPGSIAEIAAMIGVSSRTLEYSFAQVLGISPSQYMKCVRLGRARQDLRSACSNTTVAEIAMKWGFWHLGRFSNSYSSFFGELPSQTLRDKLAFIPGLSAPF